MIPWCHGLLRLVPDNGSRFDAAAVVAVTATATAAVAVDNNHLPRRWPDSIGSIYPTVPMPLRNIAA